MLKLILVALIAGGIADLMTWLVTPVVARVGLAARAVDYPGGRKRHEKAVTRLGGVALVAGLALSAAGLAVARWAVWGTRVPPRELLAFALALVMVFLVGLLEDLRGVAYWRRLAVQTLAALALVSVGWHFEVVSLPVVGAVELGWFGWVVTVLWIVGVTNAVNLIDGLDGLAGGVVAIVAASLLVFGLVQGNPLTVLLMAAMAGACVGFLRRNWRGEIFLGDAGSLTLGFLLGAISVHSSLKTPTMIAVMVPLIALGVPVVDTLLVMIVRFLNAPHGRLTRRLARMFKADRSHLHYLLQVWAPSRGAAVRMIYGLVVMSCVAALAVAMTKDAGLGIAVLGVEIAAVAVVRSMGYAAQVRAIAERGRKALRDEVIPMDRGRPRAITASGTWLIEREQARRTE